MRLAKRNCTHGLLMEYQERELLREVELTNLLPLTALNFLWWHCCQFIMFSPDFWGVYVKVDDKLHRFFVFYLSLFLKKRVF